MIFPKSLFVPALWLACQVSGSPAAARERDTAPGNAQAEALRLRGRPQANNVEFRVEQLLRDQPAARPGSRLRTLRAADFIVEGPGHHLWGLRVEGHAFAEWDGKTWQDRAIPDAVASYNMIDADFLTDANNQAWVLPFEFDRTAVFSIASGQWEVFETLEEAVAKKLVPGDSLTKSYHSANLGPASHVNGTKAFVHFDGRVHVLLNGQWHRSTLAQIGIKGLSSRGIPFFSRKGFFTIPGGDELFACMDGGQWQKIPMEKPESVPLARVIPEPPPAGWGFIGTDIKSFCWDRTGAAWLVAGSSGVVKWRDGIWRQLTDMGAPLPLRQAASFSEVLLDPAGNAFLRYDGYDLVVHYDFIAVKPAGPSPVASWEPGSGGNGTIRLAGLAEGFQRWRPGSGKWSALSQEAVIPLTGLVPGDYKVGVECFDDELSVLGAPLIVNFTIQGLTSAQAEEEIQRLRSPDLSVREEAAGVLRSQGTLTLPALRKARVEFAEDESLQWWLQALIDGIEREAEARR